MYFVVCVFKGFQWKIFKICYCLTLIFRVSFPFGYSLIKWNWTDDWNSKGEVLYLNGALCWVIIRPFNRVENLRQVFFTARSQQ